MLKKSKHIIERIVSETKSFESRIQGEGVIVFTTEHENFKGWLAANGFVQQYLPPKAGSDGRLLNHWWSELDEIGISIFGNEWVVGDSDGPMCEVAQEVVI